MTLALLVTTVQERLKAQIETLYARLETVKAGSVDAQRLIREIRTLSRLYYDAGTTEQQGM